LALFSATVATRELLIRSSSLFLLTSSAMRPILSTKFSKERNL
jgi:hypothetical protein